MPRDDALQQLMEARARIEALRATLSGRLHGALTQDERDAIELALAELGSQIAVLEAQLSARGTRGR